MLIVNVSMSLHSENRKSFKFFLEFGELHSRYCGKVLVSAHSLPSPLPTSLGTWWECEVSGGVHELRRKCVFFCVKGMKWPAKNLRRFHCKFRKALPFREFTKLAVILPYIFS